MSLNDAAELDLLHEITAERERMVKAGFIPAHDDEWTDGSLVMAAMTYATDGGQNLIPDGCEHIWAFPHDPFAPLGHRGNCVRSIGLLMAEVLRMNRKLKAESEHPDV